MTNNNPNDEPKPHGNPNEATLITYCERWNDIMKKPIEIISRDEAAKRYKSGELFSVVVGEVAKPTALLEIRWETNYAAAWFFDDKVRRMLAYTFTRVDEERLFLSEIATWTYADEARGRFNDARHLERITYTQEGGVHREVEDESASDEMLVEDYSGVDVTDHWQTVPRFGEWEELARGRIGRL